MFDAGKSWLTGGMDVVIPPFHLTVGPKSGDAAGIRDHLAASNDVTAHHAGIVEGLTPPKAGPIYACDPPIPLSHQKK
jgi:hypothetical protein